MNQMNMNMNMNQMNNINMNQMSIINMNQMNNMNMNKMNNMNQKNNMNAKQGRINCPCKIIITKSNINDISESTFINSVLQSFSSINCIKYWFAFLQKNNFIMYNNNNSPITKELYLLLFNIYTYQEPDSSNIILHYYNKLKTMYSLQIQQDPYHFFFYFL